MEDLVSVIIPAHNVENTLSETLDSVFDQTHSPIEVLVYNDGSTDRTGLILERHAGTVRQYSGENMGVSHARNYLITRSSGHYIAFLDSDDIWHPRYLESQVKILRENPAVDVVFSGYRSFRNTADLKRTFEQKKLNISHRVCNSLGLMKTIQRQSLIIQASFVLLRRSALQKVEYPFFPEDLRRCEDRYFWYSLLLGGATFSRLDSPLGGYRFTESGLSADQLLVYQDEAKAHQKLLALDVSPHYKPLRSEVRKQLGTSYRHVGKLYMGINDRNAARACFAASTFSQLSLKSLAFLVLSFLPNWAHPRWPKRMRRGPTS